ncbi:MAG TPA: ECF-type sigma factor [Thermoanaerobaculia bacterium]|nr:ECF-type sigma factor [Thermoanaerobaculia bacterium]
MSPYKSTEEITRLLSAVREGDPAAANALFSRVYRDLHALAHRQLGVRGRPGETLGTTVLVHEAYLRLAQPAGLSAVDRSHFFNLAARVMRHVVVDYARRRDAAKRSGDVVRLELDGRGEPAAAEDARLTGDLLALDAALQRLAAESPRLARLVELRFFAGLGFAEIGEVQGLTERTAKRDWRKARAFLLSELVGSPPPGP